MTVSQARDLILRIEAGIDSFRQNVNSAIESVFDADQMDLPEFDEDFILGDSENHTPASEYLVDVPSFLDVLEAAQNMPA